MNWNFDNSYSKLSVNMFTKMNPEKVSAPKMLLFNRKLAVDLGLDIDSLNENELANYLSGNEIIPSSEPLAQAYAGHQFGYFTMLGDGRAILLGEHITPQNKRFDIQLKGSGRTPYSRRGDGRATLRAMLREYLISEAMFGLKIPSSRSLAIVSSGEKIYREEVQEGVILTRIASSHIRVGTFEYAKNFLAKNELQELADYTINRHYPELKSTENPVLELLKSVMERQIDLIIDWMRVGFIHGVMNTDNMSIAGETFDYGPCTFMNAYNPKTVFSSIDVNGRYSYGNQPRIAHWNLACFANSLTPIIHPVESEAIKLADEVLDAFPKKYEEKWLAMMGNKLGFTNVLDAEKAFIFQLSNWMEDNRADYTNTFLVLQEDLPNISAIYLQEDFKLLQTTWKNLISQTTNTIDDAKLLMQANNPAFIPRNHLVEKALDEVCNNNDFTLFNQLLEAMNSPYIFNEKHADFQIGEDDGDYRTFCGT
ncbi:MAG: YdiU family protein [Bacteroidota bacterium]